MSAVRQLLPAPDDFSQLTAGHNCLCLMLVTEQKADVFEILKDRGQTVESAVATMEPRRTSSVYSDTFELDDLLTRLTRQAEEQHYAAISLLQEENTALHRKLKVSRQLWTVIIGLVRELVELTGQLQDLHMETLSRMKKETAAYLENCTAF
ncbi:hypothetical protein CGCFRS4_v016115 [Colletotrichum fructicola]|nr:hypothetical protein CGCFRS4_v016115 [Colletotrichum fructicola]